MARVNLFPDDKNLTLSKLKAFADDKINVTQMIISVFNRAENIVGKGENVGYQHFLLFPQCFEKASFSDTSKCVIVWEWVKGGSFCRQKTDIQTDKCLTNRQTNRQGKNYMPAINATTQNS